MPEINRIAVIVLNWNGADMLSECLDSLFAQDYPDYFVIVVDNGSTDGSRTVLERYQAKMGQQLQVIFNNSNLGFAGGANAGIRLALKQQVGAIALLNNDAAAKKNWLTELAAVLQDNSRIGIATGLLLNATGQMIDSTGDFYSIWGLAFPRDRDKPTQQATDSGYVFGATGGASLYRVEMLNEIGLFDEKFFAYYEDVDISFRAQLAGWKAYYTKVAVAFHRRGATSDKLVGFTVYQTLKNLPLLFIKNVPRGLLLKIGLRFMLIYPAVFLNRARCNVWPQAIKGFFAACYLLPQALADRYHIQKSRKVSAEYIKSTIWPELPPTHKRLKKLWRKLVVR